MKILINSTKNLTNYYVHAYETWKKALSLFADVRYYGEGYDNFLGWDVSDEDVYNKLDFTPDVELWCGGPGNKKPQYISNDFILKNPNKKIPKFILLCDYWEIIRDSNVNSWNRRELELSGMGIVGYFSFYPQSYNWMTKTCNTIFSKHFEFPYVYDERFSTQYQDKKWDINNQGCADLNYPFRHFVRQEIKRSGFNLFATDANNHQYKMLNKVQDPLELFFYGGDPVTNFSRLMNSCWITITDGFSLHSPCKEKWQLENSDLFLAKYPQALSSSSVLFCPKIKSSHIDELIDDYHYVSIDRNNFLEKIEYYLLNKDKLKIISKNANEWAKENCSASIVGKRILNQIKESIS